MRGGTEKLLVKALTFLRLLVKALKRAQKRSKGLRRKVLKSAQKTVGALNFAGKRWKALEKMGKRHGEASEKCSRALKFPWRRSISLESAGANALNFQGNALKSAQKRSKCAQIFRKMRSIFRGSAQKRSKALECAQTESENNEGKKCSNPLKSAQKRSKALECAQKKPKTEEPWF